MGEIDEIMQTIWLTVGSQNVLPISLVKRKGEEAKWLLYPQPEPGLFTIQKENLKKIFLNLIKIVPYTGNQSDIDDIQKNIFGCGLEYLLANNVHASERNIYLCIRYTIAETGAVFEKNITNTPELLGSLFSAENKTSCEAFFKEATRIKYDTQFNPNYYSYKNYVLTASKGKYFLGPSSNMPITFPPCYDTRAKKCPQWYDSREKAYELTISDIECALHAYFCSCKGIELKISDTFKFAYESGIRLCYKKKNHSFSCVHPRDYQKLFAAVAAKNSNASNAAELTNNEVEKISHTILLAKDILLDKNNGNVSKTFCNSPNDFLDLLLEAHKWSQGQNNIEYLVNKSQNFTKEKLNESIKEIVLS